MNFTKSGDFFKTKSFEYQQNFEYKITRELARSMNGKYNIFIAPLQRCVIQSKIFPQKSIGSTFFPVGNLATGHFSGKLFFEGHFSGQTGSNETDLEFLLCEGTERKDGHT